MAMHYRHRTLLLSHLRVDLLFIQSHPIGPASTDNGHKPALARYFAVRLHFLPKLIHRTRYDCVFVPTSQYPNYGNQEAGPTAHYVDGVHQYDRNDPADAFLHSVHNDERIVYVDPLTRPDGLVNSTQ
ncbi:hypothetical protein PTI98_007081 [Pleurotus ostreatus]|nr:hypothetical protein PTI98_007081 [Pleurotus ostreatus]